MGLVVDHFFISKLTVPKERPGLRKPFVFWTLLPLYYR